MEKREFPDIDFEDQYKISFCAIDSLGYVGSGEIRGFSKGKLCEEITNKVMNSGLGSPRYGYHWKAYDIDAAIVGKSDTARLDYKYWNTEIRNKIADLIDAGNPTIKAINQIKTLRGKSPNADNYVDKEEGYAVVIKAGSCITRFGELNIEGADWIEKSLYEEYVEKSIQEGSNMNLLLKGDVILASTGDGTLGKACVYDMDIPAIADSHVTIIRTDLNDIDPYYLSDYLRVGFWGSTD